MDDDIQSKEGKKNGVMRRVELWQEGTLYHVMRYQIDSHGLEESWENGIGFWQVFNSVKDARKVFRAS